MTITYCRLGTKLLPSQKCVTNDRPSRSSLTHTQFLDEITTEADWLDCVLGKEKEEHDIILLPLSQR